jgi:hypothetical protein
VAKFSDFFWKPVYFTGFIAFFLHNDDIFCICLPFFGIWSAKILFKSRLTLLPDILRLLNGSTKQDIKKTSERKIPKNRRFMCAANFFVHETAAME